MYYIRGMNTSVWFSFKSAMHLLCWLMLLLLLAGFLQNAGQEGVGVILLLPQLWLFLLFYAGLFYLNSLGLLPVLYFRKKKLLYWLLLSGLLAFVIWLQPFDHLMNLTRTQPMPEPPFPSDLPPGAGSFPPAFHRPGHVDIVSIVLFVVVMVSGMALSLAQQWQATRLAAREAERQRAEAELAFLKAQIHPHFLFNTLNNIYSMVVTGHEQAPEAILRLSGLLRYLTDESQTNLVDVQREVACIQYYVDLQQLRLADTMQLELDFCIDNPKFKVPPLSLMTFVENAFTHGVSAREPGWIKIVVRAEAQQLYFSCTNKIFTRPEAAHSGGIGISNVRKRLQQLFPNQHELQIVPEPAVFSVQLTLETSIV